MYRKGTNRMKNIVATLIAGALAFLPAGCADTKAVSQRGWIGGEYILARPNSFRTAMNNSGSVRGSLPSSLKSKQKSAIQITGMATNAPAEVAGLRKGDFVLEVNQRRVASLRGFQEAIDRSAPGSVLAIKAYRDGRFLDCQVPVGREKYKNEGCLSIVLPTVVHRWDLWPNPGFSLVVVGYEPNPGLRRELSGANQHEEVYDEDWSAYLGFVEVSHGKRVIAQEPITAATAPGPD